MEVGEFFLDFCHLLFNGSQVPNHIDSLVDDGTCAFC